MGYDMVRLVIVVLLNSVQSARAFFRLTIEKTTQRNKAESNTKTQTNA